MVMKMKGEKIFYDCFSCGKDFQYGPHLYSGRLVTSWGVEFCEVCVNANWDGIVLEANPKLSAHLQGQKIPIKLNAKGWLDIP